jgi:transcriptional regulator with XRE-family HTH domain
MKFLSLQNQLREHIRARIRRRELTGIGLARAAGFPQSHLSNFLNFRRGLSLESMDRLLETLGIGVIDLLSSQEILCRAGVAASADEFEPVALVSSDCATVARFKPEQVIEWHSISKRFLRRLRPSEPHDRDDWRRFVLIKLDAESAHDNFPTDAVTATMLIDRHYNSLEPYRRAKPNLYAVNFGEGCAAGYLSLIRRNLVLRTCAPQRELRSVHIAAGHSYSQHIIGRVVQVGLEV